MPVEALTTEDVMRLLRIGRGTLWRLLNTGALPSFRVGRRRLVLRRDLEVFLDRLVEEQRPPAQGGRR